MEDILQHISLDHRGLVSFDEFAQCRLRLINEIEQEKMPGGAGAEAAGGTGQQGWGQMADSDNSMGK